MESRSKRGRKASGVLAVGAARKPPHVLQQVFLQSLLATLAQRYGVAALVYAFEFAFAPPRRWRFDLSFPVVKVAVEFQGGVWSRGRHVRGAGYVKDCEKLIAAAADGWLVFPIPYDLLKGVQMLKIVQAVAQAIFPRCVIRGRVQEEESASPKG